MGRRLDRCTDGGRPASVRDGEAIESRHGVGSRRISVLLYEPVPLIADALCLFLASQPDIEATCLSDLGEFLASVAGAALAVVCFQAWGTQVATILQYVRARTDAPLVLLGPDDRAHTPHLRIGRGVSICERATPEAFMETIRGLAFDGNTNSHDARIAHPKPEARAPSLPMLTPREQEIVSLIAEDLTAHQIATLLHVSERTIHSHLRNAYKKLGVHGRVGAVEAARREGLLRRRTIPLAGAS